MTRQWLALIALLTGLAAVGAPVDAHTAEALSCEIGAAPDVSAACESELASHANILVADRILTQERVPTPLKIMPGLAGETVLIGIDRAYE